MHFTAFCVFSYLLMLEIINCQGSQPKKIGNARAMQGEDGLLSCKYKQEKMRLHSSWMHESKLLTLLLIFSHPVQNAPSDVVLVLFSVSCSLLTPLMSYILISPQISLLHLSMVRVLQASHKHLVLSSQLEDFQ